MTEEKIKRIAELLQGVPEYEWSNIRTTIDRIYSDAFVKLELPDASTIEEKLKFYCKHIIDD